MVQPKGKELRDKIEKLDLAKIRKEMYGIPTKFDWENESLIREIVAREINLIETKLNEIIDRLNSNTNKG